MTITTFIDFRQKLYNRIETRPDSTLDLIDALSGNTSARSIPELSLSPSYHREYSSLYKSIGDLKFTQPETTPEQPPAQINLACEQLGTKAQPCKAPYLDLTAELVPSPSQRPFYLFALDATPNARPTASTLADRSFVHTPNPISTNKPITIGHEYSIVSALPEETQTQGVPWTIPLMAQRIPTQSNAIAIANQQVEQLFAPELPWHQQLLVLVSDSHYGVASFLYPQAQQDNCLVISRVRSNRVFYGQPEASEQSRSIGHPSWYGQRFALQEPESWHQADEVLSSSFVSSRGKSYQVQIQAWHNLLMRGTKAAPMHQHPFTLIRVEMEEVTMGIKFKPMWLVVCGKRRQEISALVAWQSYRQRFHQEHGFRFMKQRLFMTKFQTPEVEHEQNWIHLTLLAYAQLWAARDLATCLPRPWERYQPTHCLSSSTRMTPSMVQRDFARIIAEIGTPACAPKPRGNSPGRAKGNKQTPRPRHEVVKKVRKVTTSKKKSA